MIEFSVVIPLYNKANSIKDTLECLINQTYSFFEVIVINDGSTDDSLKAVCEVTDSRIRIINKDNSGVSATRNVGIKQAKYEWIAFLDADDLWNKDYLKNIVRLIYKYPAAKVLSNDYKMITREEALNMVKLNAVIGEDYIVKDFFEKAFERPFVNSSNIVIHKNCFDYLGYFNESLKYGEDLDMWCRLGRVFVFAHANSIMSYYVFDSENRVSNHTKVDYNTTSLFNLCINKSTTISEKKYYAKRIISELKYLIRNFYIITSLILLYKNISLIKYIFSLSGFKKSLIK